MSREMKDSRVEWIGEIPKNWDVMKLLFVLRRSITDGPHETPNLVESQEGIPFISVDSLNNTKQVDLSIVKKYISVKDYKEYRKKAFLEKGDVLFTKAATIGKTAIVDNPTEYMIWSPIAILKPNEKCFNEYLYYILNCKEAIKYTRDIIGHETTQVNVGMRDLEKLKIPIAPFDEQKRIAIFLDSKCEAIDLAIQKQKDIVDKLMEYRQSTITQAITKGLNPNSEMKDSGVECIGEIPQNWKTYKLKYITKLRKEKAINKENYIGLENVESKTGKFIGSQVKPDGDAIIFHKNDVLFGKLRPYLSKSLLVEQEGCCSGEFLVITPKQVIPKYLLYITLSKTFVEHVNSSTYGAKMPRSNWEFVRNMMIPLPTESEQKGIISYLDKKLASIDNVIESTNTIIQKLEEYKKSLIYNAVTGKIDCRGEVK